MFDKLAELVPTIFMMLLLTLMACGALIAIKYTAMLLLYGLPLCR